MVVGSFTLFVLHTVDSLSFREILFSVYIIWLNKCSSIGLCVGLKGTVSLLKLTMNVPLPLPPPYPPLPFLHPELIEDRVFKDKLSDSTKFYEGCWGQDNCNM